MVLSTASQAILSQLAEEHRVVLSGWRAVILMRRATFSIPASDRRWSELPAHVEDLSPLIAQMRRRGEIRKILSHPVLHRVTVPYAQQGSVDEREAFFEIHPYATLSHLSALTFHGLTTEFPNRLTATVSADRTGGLLPPQTGPGDWEGVFLPAPAKPSQILGMPVTWKTLRPEAYFGFAEYQPLGFTVRYTSIERTLLDGLTSPDLSGGIGTVLGAWGMARDVINLDVLIHQAERLDIALLRQRVGFILDQLQLTHPELEAWRQRSKRGGSSKLVSSQPYSPNYDERWNLSINASITALAQ